MNWQAGGLESANDEAGTRGERGRHFEGRGGGRGPEGRGGGRGPEGRSGGRGPGGRGGGRDRARRGDARYLLLDALRDGPKHGYEIIKALEERTAGKYVPSPGTVYPTMQYLEDQGLVNAIQEADRRIYQLTEAGLAELDAHATQVAAFWKRFAGESVATATQHEIRFLEDELEHLNRIVWSGLHTAIARGQDDAIRRVRSAVEECQKQVREIIATEQPK
ncbi:MAG: PadR family transcriptional regulator [Anaerolineales bacterium]|nr:PadR family transcriptional regulator [Anaerolineales bacterium]